jgi:hypothetical protein
MKPINTYLLFQTPADLVEYENESAGPFAQLSDTLGWSEMETAMWKVLLWMVRNGNDWQLPIDLKEIGVLEVDAFCPFAGHRKFTEYFELREGRYYMGLEPFFKIHKGIAEREP